MTSHRFYLKGRHLRQIRRRLYLTEYGREVLKCAAFFVMLAIALWLLTCAPSNPDQNPSYQEVPTPPGLAKITKEALK